MSRHLVAIAGATGAAAARLTELLAADPAFRVVGLCRNPPARGPEGVRYIATDFLSGDSCRAALAAAGPVSHLVYAARAPFGEGGVEDVAGNLAMLRHLLDAAETPALRHVHLLEGGKWYGLHIGPYATPSREDDARHMPPDFYYDQQDLLSTRRVGKDWRWSASRPQYLVDFAPGRARNLVTVIGALAALCRETGTPFDFPGSPAAFAALSEITDCSLLARFIRFAITAPEAADQAFNITNGDTFRWQRLWPKLAAYFGLPMGVVRPMKLERWMADKAPMWRAIAARHDLVLPEIAEVALWPYGDFVWSIGWDVVSSLGRARAAGWTEYADTEAQMLRHLDAYRAARVLP